VADHGVERLLRVVPADLRQLCAQARNVGIAADTDSEDAGSSARSA
jgi:hypothetical protein